VSGLLIPDFNHLSAVVIRLDQSLRHIMTHPSPTKMFHRLPPYPPTRRRLEKTPVKFFENSGGFYAAGRHVTRKISRRKLCNTSGSTTSVIGKRRKRHYPPHSKRLNENFRTGWTHGSLGSYGSAHAPYDEHRSMGQSHLSGHPMAGGPYIFDPLTFVLDSLNHSCPVSSLSRDHSVTGIIPLSTHQ
jgi:hypothetical protein